MIKKCMQYIVLINPKSRNFSDKTLNFIEQKLKKKKFNYKIYLSQSINSFQKEFPLILNLYNKEQVTIIVVGGDGTLNKVCNLLVNMNKGKRFLIGIIPAGTANILAKEFDIKNNITFAIEKIFEGNYREVTLSKINERYFLFSCGIGFDGMVVKEVNEKLKKISGGFSYAVKGFQILKSQNFKKFKVKIDDFLEYETCSIILNRTQRYAINKKIFKTAYILSDYFIVALFKRLTIKTLINFFLGVKSDDYIFRKAKKIEILNENSLPIQIDGEFVDINSKNLDISISDKKINFIMP